MPQRRPADRGSILTRLRRAGLSRFGHRAGVKAAANPPPAVQHVSQTAARPGCGGAAVVHASAIQNDTLGLTVGSGEVCTLNAAVSSSPFAAADTFKKWTICELYGQPVTGVADVKAAFARARAEQGGGCVRSIPATMVLRNGDAAASRRALGSLPAAPGRTTAVFAMRRPPSASWGLRVRDLPGGIGSVLVHVGAGTPSAGAGAEAMVGWRIARVTAAGRPPLLAPSRNDVLSCLEPCSDAVVEFEPIDREMLEAMPAEQLVRVLECLPRLDRGDMYGVLLRLCSCCSPLSPPSLQKKTLRAHRRRGAAAFQAGVCVAARRRRSGRTRAEPLPCLLRRPLVR
eukprot:TRINITY_DN627_c4_g1_i2.p1 TRINITY_DN627_c4_g1~~TRINITY_DN627_c4_g1_i2.p1  ORF type:complete len:343 (+),score=74.85 TRINITY_DN627_c4_g1_i2:264-1292(+)